METEVFISYSSMDKSTADAVCAILENNNLRCWIAPRDILPGETYGSAIINGINNCKVVLIVFSSHSNASGQVINEIERSVSKEKIIIPFRIEDIKPSGEMELFLSRRHWLDAITVPLENHIHKLADIIKQLLHAEKGTNEIRSGSKIVANPLQVVSKNLYTNEIISNKNPNGKEPDTVKVGSQIWLSENLNTDLFRNGDIIPQATSFKELMSSGIDQVPTWCYYAFDSSNGDAYGKLYNWYAIMDERGLAPDGFHVPDKEEFDTLINHYGGEGQNAYVSMIQGGGFHALLGGHSGFGSFSMDRGFEGNYWSSTPVDNKAFYMNVSKYSRNIKINIQVLQVFMSVRCLKDSI